MSKTFKRSVTFLGADGKGNIVSIILLLFRYTVEASHLAGRNIDTQSDCKNIEVARHTGNILLIAYTVSGDKEMDPLCLP